MTFLESILTQFFAPSEQATIPVVVPGDHLLAANSLYQATSCLLYTSPSPRDVEESRMPSSA